MNAEDLKNWIDSLTQDIDFVYQGKNGVICPFDRRNISLCYDGKEITVHSVLDAMQTPFINGYALNDICGQLEI